PRDLSCDVNVERLLWLRRRRERGAEERSDREHERDDHPEQLVAIQTDDDRREDDEAHEERAVEREREQRVGHQKISLWDDGGQGGRLGRHEENRYRRH